MGRQCHRYTPEEIQFLRDNIAGCPYAELMGMFNKRFGCPVTVKALKQQAGSLGLRNNIVHRWTPEEKLFLRDNIAGRSYAELKEMFNKRFGLHLSERQIKSMTVRLRLCNGIYRGPVPAGKERSYNGVTEVKTGNDGHGRRQHKGWRLKHHVIWEKANGPVPKGHAVIFADGDGSNFAIENLLLVSRGELGYMHRYGFKFPDRELTEAGHALAALRIAVAERKRELGIGAPKWTAKKKQGADRHDNGTETEAANRRSAGNNPAGKEAAV